MKQARIDKKITLRELSKKTGIEIGRLSNLEHLRAEPSSSEVDQIALVLGSKIKFADSERAKKEREYMRELRGFMKTIFDEIKSRGLGTGHGGSGKMICPKCGNDLIFTVSSLNGHIWGKCLTVKCLSWMQ